MSLSTVAVTDLAQRPEPLIGRWSPLAEFATLRRQMDDLVGSAFGSTAIGRTFPSVGFDLEPLSDIHETDEKFDAQIALPGYTPKDINVEATGKELRITGERKSLYDDEKAVAHRKNGVSSSSSFSFYYGLPSEIDPNKVKASFENGVLKVELPKSEPSRAESVKVNVQSV